jgi:hypothetical protein
MRRSTITMHRVCMRQASPAAVRALIPDPAAIRTGRAMSMPRLDSRSPLLLDYPALLGRSCVARSPRVHLRLIEGNCVRIRGIGHSRQIAMATPSASGRKAAIHTLRRSIERRFYRTGLLIAQSLRQSPPMGKALSQWGDMSKKDIMRCSVRRWQRLRPPRGTENAYDPEL